MPRKKVRQYLVFFSLTLMITLAALSGCNLFNPDQPPSNQPPLNQPSPTNSTPAPQQISTPAPRQISALSALPSFADLVDLAQPSVVAVNTQTVVRTRFIQRTLQGAGSGWIIDESGIIVTNNHVVEGATSVSVELSDGRTYIPVSINTDPSTDLAILKINAGKLPALKVGDSSKLRAGDWVVAVGNALGLGIGVKNGIVSRVKVNVQISQTETYTNLIETNAAINPGNSGGPLLNLAGEVIGITSLKLSTAGVEGMGYAININDAIPVIQILSQ